MSSESDKTPDDRTRIAAPPGDAAQPPDAAPPAPPVAEIVAPGVLINDNYRILNLVSAGGMGEVYRAENIFTGDPVAVKIILPNLARDESIIDLFRREARILVQMRDDAIVRYHNFVRDKGLDRYCLIMEFVEGRHLWDRIQNAAPLDADQALVLMRRLARGLAQAHARGVTHRDLSPDNVILRDDRIDEAVLIDFGIARSTELGDGLNGRFAGKFKYIAPEQLGHAGGEIGPPADVYGLALMIAAAMRGTPLEMGSSVVEASEARRQIPDLTGISHRVYPLLQHMLEPTPSERPRDMDMLLRIMDDPTHLPARYRMPLWQVRDAHAAGSAGLSLAPGQAGGQTLGQTSGQISGIGLPDSPDSDSPFAAIRSGAVAEPAVAAKPARRGWLAAVAAVAVAGAAVGGWFIWGRDGAPVDPVVTPTTPDLPDTQRHAALPPRDVETRDGFLAEQPLPGCTVAMRLASGPDAGKIGILADGPRDLSALQQAYSTRFGTSPAVVPMQIRAPQCAALDFIGALSGRAAMPPTLSLDAAETESGGAVSGRIRDLAGRSLWLFVVSPKGGVYDLSSTAVAQADGSFAFDFGISLAADETGPQPQLIVALASNLPLTSVAAAPAGSNADVLMPLVLDEIAANGGDAALSAAVMAVISPKTEQMPDETPPAETPPAE